MIKIVLGRSEPKQVKGKGKVKAQTSQASVHGPDPRIPPWKSLIAKDQEYWNRALQSSKMQPKKRVLVANNLPGYNNGSVVESVLTAALTLRGAEVDVLVCQGVLSACLNLKSKNVKSPEEIQNGDWKKAPQACGKCQKFKTVFSDLGVGMIDMNDHLTATELEQAKQIAKKIPLSEISTFKLGDVAIGEHAKAGALRYFAMGNADDEPGYEIVLRKYLEGALQTHFALRSLFRKKQYDVVVFHHGIYVPQGIVGEVCRSEGLRVVNWNPAYRKKCFIFSHGDTYHHTLMNEPVEAWKTIPFSEDLQKETLSYLAERMTGAKDWIWFHNEPDSKTDSLVKETGIDINKPIIGCLTNVIWDAQLHYPKNAFKDMMDWLLKTIEWFSHRPHLQLLIRVHPAEIRGLTPSRQLAVDEIRKSIPSLPNNVFVIGPESEISTYSAMGLCNSVIIYGTKTGVELTSRGVPVIVAGEAWIKNKGLTIDAESSEQYFKILESLPLSKDSVLSQEKIKEAQKYAFHFFFRRMIPIDCFQPLETHKKMPFQFSVDSLHDLSKGRDRGLDVICEGILDGTPFIYPYEKLN